MIGIRRPGCAEPAHPRNTRRVAFRSATRRSDRPGLGPHPTLRSSSGPALVAFVTRAHLGEAAGRDRAGLARLFSIVSRRMSSAKDATASYVGYIYQGRYALVALLESPNAVAVSVETDDDVVIDGRDVTLAQLKHSLGTPPDLTITNVGFWKTLRIWAERESTAGPHGAVDSRYCFVTVADVAEGDSLLAAVQGAERTLDGDEALVAALTVEAERVMAERGAPRPPGAAAPHA